MYTPSKRNEKDIPETGVKEEEEEEEESRFRYDEGDISEHREDIEHFDTAEKNRSSEETLAQIESEIKLVEDRLKEIKEEQKAFPEDSEKFDELDDETRVLKKEAIDLDHQHRIAFNKHLQEKKKNESTERTKAEEVSKVETAQLKAAPLHREKDYRLEASLAEQRYNAKIRELELELAESSLQRSRRLALEADLISIRSLTPYYWSRYYDSLYLPLYSDYLYSDYLYSPLLYSPYPDLYYSRYSYLSDPLYYPRYIPYLGLI